MICIIEGTKFRDSCKGAHNEGCKKRDAQENEHVGEILQGHGEMGVMVWFVSGQGTGSENQPRGLEETKTWRLN